MWRLLMVAVATHLAGATGPLPAGAQSAAAPSPTLWVLAVGVSRYVDPGLTLRFAESDARAIADALLEQKKGPLYAAVNTKVLVDAQVTRTSILENLESFLGQAAPTDIGVIYLAGHGVHDPSTDSYYFLPANAAVKNLLVEGLDMVEFDRQVQRVHRNLGALVVVLDTCYAGGVVQETRDIQLGGDLASRLAASEGLYILAAAKSGEQSRETEALGHGAFTKALLDGLRGAAADADGMIRVLGLASYAARVVPQLTDGRQHPYYRILGGNPVLAVHLGQLARITPPPLASAQVETPLAPRRERIAILNFQNLRHDPEHDWMEKALGEEFTTTLNLVTQLDVYAEPELRFMARGTTDALEAARQAGMAKVVSGTFAVQNNRISMTAHVKDVQNLRHIASAKIEGPLNKFFALRSQLVLDLLENLRLELPRAEVERVLKPGTTDLRARKLLFDAESAGAQAAPKPTPPTQLPPHGALGERLLALLGLAGPSYALEGDDSRRELSATLESFRTAFEHKDLDALAHYYIQFSEAQRAALARYLQNADELHVEFNDVRITLSGNEAAVSFTRRDRFVDHQTGERQQVVVRLTKLFAKRGDEWQIAPEQ
jgi:uncharacterized caspase-like protein/ketosteroid isomerase-like protein